MTEREAFKYGFLKKCAEMGLTAEEAEGLARFAVKRGDGVIGTALDVLRKGIAMGAGATGRALVLTPLVAIPTAFGAGYHIARSVGVNKTRDVDPDREKERELAHAYEIAARNMRESAAAAQAVRANEADDFARADRREGRG